MYSPIGSLDGSSSGELSEDLLEGLLVMCVLVTLGLAGLADEDEKAETERGGRREASGCV